MNPRLFWSFFILIILGWGISIAYSENRQLEEPIFLDHYIDKFAQDEIQLKFYYLTNKNDDSSVNYVEIGKYPGYVEYFDPFSEEVPDEAVFNHHVLRSIDVNLDLRGMKKIDEKFQTNKITVHFSDGRTVKADIGELAIHPEEIPENTLALNQSGSNGGDGLAIDISAEQFLSVEKISSTLPEHVSDRLNIEVPETEETLAFNGIFSSIEDIQARALDEIEYPFELENRQSLYFLIRPEEPIPYYIDSWLMLSGENQQKADFVAPAYLQFSPLLDSKTINDLIERKEAD